MFRIAKNRLRGSVVALAMAGILLPATSAQAATQGTIGTTSTGSIAINATIAGLVQISNLTDLTFSSLNGSAAATQAENVCVWSNTSTRSYTVRATGNGTAGAFTLASGQLAPVTYSVAWAGTSAASSGTALTTNVTSAPFTSAAILPTCVAGASPTATLLVTIAAADQASMVANATYAGTLTLLVAPQ